MDEITKIRLIRKSDDPDTETKDVSLVEALQLAIIAVQDDPSCKHIIICIGKERDDGTACASWRQGGSYGPFSQIGLLEEVKSRMMAGD